MLGTISLSGGTSDLAASGTGSVSLTTARNISTSGSGITTVNGNLTLSANQQMTATTGTFAGILLDSAIRVRDRQWRAQHGGSGRRYRQQPIRHRFPWQQPRLRCTTGTMTLTGTAGATTGSSAQGIEVRQQYRDFRRGECAAHRPGRKLRQQRGHWRLPHQQQHHHGHRGRQRHRDRHRNSGCLCAGDRNAGVVVLPGAIIVTANQVDVDAGKLAQERATNPEVKKFAERMVSDQKPSISRPWRWPRS